MFRSQEIPEAIEDCQRRMETLSKLHVETPLIESTPLSKLLGVPVFLKLEALQPSALQEKKCDRFVSSSGGNAGLALAYSGRKLNIPVTVVVPETTKEFMRKKIQDEGAQVIVHGSAWDEANEKALDIAKDPSVHFVHPFDHPHVWTGNSTMISEMRKEGFPKPSLVVTAVGGGGLMAGLIEGLQREGWGDVPVFACETEGAASFQASWKAGKLVTLSSITSVATSLGAKTVSFEALRRAQLYAEGKSVIEGGPTGTDTPPSPEDPPRIQSVILTDSQAISACGSFARDHRLLVEPACGAAIATIYESHLDIISIAKQRGGPVVVIVCGGAGVEPKLLEEWERMFPK